MKQLLSFVFLLASISFTVGQTKVPKAVLAAFSSDYTAAQETVWQKLDFGYRAEFMLDTTACLAEYDQFGQRYTFAVRLKFVHLPIAAMAYLNQTYADAIINQILWVEDLTGQYFAVVATFESTSEQLFFDKEGRKTDPFAEDAAGARVTE